MPGLRVQLVSGGSGRTAQHVLRACLAQFPDPDQCVIQESSVRCPEAARAVVDEVAKMGAVICHTLVDPEVRNALSESALAQAVPCVDVLGPMLAVLGEHLSQTPKGQAGLLYELHREQFDRMDAVDFTMAHDDGSRVHDLDQADVVLVGASRVSKSVTCFYLASRGVRAANVPLVPGQDLPEELLRLDSDRVFGLTMNASHLAAVRKARLHRISDRDVPPYTDIRELNRELWTAEELMVRHGWHQVDVSYKATEEVASYILDRISARSKSD